jgi:hypothetical protein
MGWLSDIGDWVWSKITAATDWVKEQLAKAQAWVVSALEQITEEIKVWKYRFRKKIAEWMGDPIFFWLAIAVTASLVIYAPKLAAWFAKTKVKQFVDKAYDVVKDLSGTILEKIGYIQILSVHKIGLIFFEDYQAFWGKLDEAFAGMAEEIELGVGTINVLMQSVRNLYYSTYSLFGYNSDMIETQFYDDITAWTAKAQARWERYVRNPQQFFTDIQNELIFPILERKAGAGEESAFKLLELNNKIQEFVDKTNTVREDFNSLVEALPDEIEAAVRTQIGTGLDAVNSFYEDTVLPTMAKIEESVLLIDQTIKDMNYAMELNAQRKSDFISLLRLSLFSGELDTLEARELLGELLSRSIGKTSETMLDEMLINDMEYTIADDSNNSSTIDSISREPIQGHGIDISTIKLPKGGWFVGEY